MAAEPGPNFTTPRLRLRPPVTTDSDFVQDMYSRAAVMRFIGTGQIQPTRDQALDRIQRYRRLFGPGTGAWLLEGIADGAPLGFALLKHIPFSADISEADPSAAPDVEIGWHLHPDAWGRGYAAEAATELIAHARHCGHQDLVAVTHPDNHPSQAVARRIGMTSAGLTQRYYDTVCELFTLTL